MAAGAICLLSGGLDSTVALALAREQGPVALALTADYGQRAAAREVERAGRIAAHFAVAHRVLELPFFKSLPGGALLDRAAELPRVDRGALERGAAGPTRELEESAARVWVPNRNGVLIEAAAAFAEASGAALVIVGFNREEASTFPDNSIDYMAAMNAALRFSTRGKVRLESPTAPLDKVEIVRAALRLRVPLDLVWPCYEGGEAPCGACESCQRFRRAVDRAGARVSFGG
jgi:7-cyano-7-deazaguanine synthase